MSLPVSILARPEGRALPQSSALFNTNTEFQSSPAPKDGRYFGPPHVRQAPCRFQSSPAPKDGRYHGVSQAWKPRRSGFNPRPPRRTGATQANKKMTEPANRFNPRPPRRTGATTSRSRSAGSNRFQSSPAPKDGRYLGARAGRPPASRGFNPRPPRRTGATRYLG